MGGPWRRAGERQVWGWRLRACYADGWPCQVSNWMPEAFTCRPSTNSGRWPSIRSRSPSRTEVTVSGGESVLDGEVPIVLEPLAMDVGDRVEAGDAGGAARGPVEVGGGAVLVAVVEPECGRLLHRVLPTIVDGGVMGARARAGPICIKRTDSRWMRLLPVAQVVVHEPGCGRNGGLPPFCPASDGDRTVFPGSASVALTRVSRPDCRRTTRPRVGSRPLIRSYATRALTLCSPVDPSRG